MEILNFIEDHIYIVAVALWVIGTFLKGSSKVKDALIPWILIILGLGFSIWIDGFNPDAVIQGILAAGGAVLVDNLIKQTREIVDDMQ